MKNIAIFILMIIVNFVDAQSFTITPESNILVLNNMDNIFVEGYDGQEVVLDAPNITAKAEKIDGLRLINSKRKSDNTGLGVNYSNDKKGLVFSKIPSNVCGSQNFKLMVPHGMQIDYRHSSYEGDLIQIRNISGDVNISSNYNSMILENLSGAISAKTVYGSIDLKLNSQNQSGPIALYSVYEYIDLTVPKDMRGDLFLKTTYGQIYTDLDLEIIGENNKDEHYGSNIEAKLNNGGSAININSTYSNIYMRSK